MYIPNRNLFVAQIPKCGSRTLVEAAQIAHGPDNVFLDEHLTVSMMVRRAREQQLIRSTALYGETELYVLAVVRSPPERLLSGINALYGDTPAVTLTEALRAAETHRQPVFHPQIRYLDRVAGDEEYTTKLLPMDRIDLAMKIVGYDGSMFNHSFSTRRWKLEEIVDHPVYQRLIQRYEALDGDLYREAVNAAKKN